MTDRERVKRVIRFLVIGTAIVVVLGYAVFAFRDIIRGPKIEISEPTNGETYSSSTILVKGRAIRIKDITLNGRSILIDEQGNFSEFIVLFPGYNVETLVGVDKFGRSTSYKLELMKK